MRLLLLIFIFFNLSANDILTSYRLNGIENIEQEMDQELAHPEYWMSFLKDKDTKFGYSEVYNAILVCDKEKSTLSLFKKSSKKKFTFLQDYNAFTGKMKGEKKTEGDFKTPIGIYNLTTKLSNVDSFYGPMAFVTSYPNLYDQYRGRNGHGIWIHGLPTDEKRDEFTKGCIAIDNDGIECLDKTINIDKTLLIIYKDKTQQEASKEKLSKILAQLYAWRYAWLYNDLKSYLSFYSKEFVRSDRMDFNAFKNYKKRIFAKDEKKKILFKNISVIAYPNSENIYQITFSETYKSDSFEFQGDKTLIVREDDQSNFQILTEK